MDNKLVRTQDYSGGEWVYNDVFTQNYNLKWDYTFSSRLKTTFDFKLVVLDDIKSRDIDKKDVTPSLDISLVGKVWDLKLTLKDTITFSNEFNVFRHDLINTGINLNLTPDILPPLKASYRIDEDYQRGLMDTYDKKFDVSTTYSFASGLSLDGAWRTGERNDLLLPNSDTRNHSWDANLNYNGVLTPALKLSYSNALKGGLDETFDHDTGVVLGTIPTHTIGNKLKLNLDAFPAGTTSVLELSRDQDLPARDVKEVVGFETNFQQKIISFATIKEILRYDYISQDNPTVRDAEDKLALTLDVTGSPYLYLDYSLKYNLTVSEKESLNRDLVGATRTGKFDATVTLNPTEPFLLDLAYSRELKRDKGVASQTRTFKAKGTFKGEFLDIPNLTFNPSLTITRDYNRANESFTRSNDLKLDFKYNLDLPRPFILELGPSYAWANVDGSRSSQNLALTYKFQAKLTFSSWILDALASGDFQNQAGPADDSGKWTLNKEVGIDLARDLTGTINARTRYRYKVPADASAGNNDHLEVGLTWDFINLGTEFLYTRDRTFVTPRVDTKKYTARFTMDF